MEKCGCSIEKCTEFCKKCPLILLVAGVILLIIGLVFDAVLLKLLWLIIGALVAIAGGVLFALPYVQKKK